MSLLRALRVLRGQWWVIVLVALLGAGVAMGAAELRNRSLEPVFEAVGPLTVLRLPEEPDDRFERRVETVVAEARSAVADRLSDTSLRVEEGQAGGVVHFVATAPTSDAAMTAATDLRNAYLEATPAGTAEDQLSAVLGALITEIELVESQLAELRQDSAPDVVLEAERTALLTRLGSATEERASLEAQLLDPDLTDEVRTAAEGRLETLEVLIGVIGRRLQEMPQPETSVIDTETRLRVRALEERLQALESQYVANAQRQSEPGSEGLVGTPFVADRTGERFSPLLAAAVGIVAGTLLGAVGVVASDRINQPVRSLEDVRGMTVIPVRRRPARSTGGFNWYRSALGDPRRADIQALRASADRAIGHGGVIAVGGIDRANRDAPDIARDLSASMAATGRAVLFIETNFGSAPSSDSGASLAEILDGAARTTPDRSAVKQMLWDRTEEAPGLLVVPAGFPTVDPIDSLAGPAFEKVIDEARHTVDAVLISTPVLGTPTADAVLSHSSLAVLAVEKDRTRNAELRDAVARIRELGVAAVLGALVAGRSHLRRNGTRHIAERKTTRRRRATT